MRIKLASALAGAALLCLGSVSPAFAQTTTYSYDVFGRLSTVSTAGGAQTSYAYDAADNRSQVVKTSGVQVIGAAKHRKTRRWLQFAISRKRPPGVAKPASAAFAVAPTAPVAGPASSAAAGRIALASVGR